MPYLDCYAVPQGAKGHIEGFPESTFHVDLADERKDKILSQLSCYFALIQEVEETNGQAIVPLSDMIPYLDAESGVKRREGPGEIRLL